MPHSDPKEQKEYFKRRYQRIKDTNREDNRIRMAKWREANPEKRKAASRRANYSKSYNLSVADYENMLLAQQGVCKLCNQTCVTGRRLAIDHDHKTGKVRGLLCSLCNRGLGMFKDNPELLLKAVSYVKGN